MIHRVLEILSDKCNKLYKWIVYTLFVCIKSTETFDKYVYVTVKYKLFCKYNLKLIDMIHICDVSTNKEWLGKPSPFKI